jgi:1,4-alpha-glucan branching enzyme
MGEHMSRKNENLTDMDKVAKRKKISFSVQAPEAKEVLLMGDFNNWDPKANPMKNDGWGVWSKSVLLSPGTYEYKFLIDGQWKEDMANDKYCLNCYGTTNSIVDLA